ncbi:MAG: protein kinase [Anaerolineae bacterium]|nr:protein kinase [Anaerolineae bacterium]
MSITDPLIGKRLGDYLIEGVLGTGGMARVYRGYDDNLDRYAAIKVIEPQLIASAEEDEYRERFLREARAIARLNHPRIVGIYQFNQVGNIYYIAMEYIEGRNLRDVLKSYIKQDKLMPTKDMLLILRDIAEALDYAHGQSIIHRDIKPSNIIITEDGNAVLTDFGLALNAVEGTIGNTFGSVHYIAPEQAISSAQAVPQSDQYSLGIVAYELLTGRVPFDDASAMSVALKHISDPPPPPTELNPNIPAEVEQALLKSLDKEVSKRYLTATEFIKALEFAFSMMGNPDVSPPLALLSSTPTETTPVPPPELSKDSSQDNLKTQMAATADQSKNTSSIADALLSTTQRRSVTLGSVLVVLAIIIIAGLLFMNNSSKNAAATETAIAQTATEAMAIQIAQQTEIAAANSTSTAMADEVNTAEAVIAQQTQDAEASATAAIQQTNIAIANATQTAIQAQMETAQAIIDQQTQNAIATATEQARPTLTPSITPTDILTNTPSPTETNTPRPSRTPTPELAISSQSDTRQVILRYDGRSLIIANRDIENINVSDLIFVRFEPDEDGELQQNLTYIVDNARAFNSEVNNLRPGRCLQILDSTKFRGLPPEEDNFIAADLCTSTPFWTTTVTTFWISEDRRSYFEVRLGTVDVLGHCVINVPDTRREIRCAIDLQLP